MVEQLDPVWSIGAFQGWDFISIMILYLSLMLYEFPMSDIRPSIQPMCECSVCVFLPSYGY